MADPFREKRVVRRNKAVFQKSCRDPSPARQGGINPALKSDTFSLGRFYYDIVSGLEQNSNITNCVDADWFLWIYDLGMLELIMAIAL